MQQVRLEAPAIAKAITLGQELAAQQQAEQAKQDALQDFLSKERDTSAAEAWLAGQKQAKEELQGGLMAYYTGRKEGEEKLSDIACIDDNMERTKTFIGPTAPTPNTHQLKTKDIFDASCNIADAIDPLSPNPEFVGTGLGWGEVIDQAVIIEF